jgi:hypothetical protein
MAGYVRIDEKELKDLEKERDSYKSQVEKLNTEIKTMSQKMNQRAAGEFNAFTLNVEAVTNKINETADNMVTAMLTPYNTTVLTQLDEYATEVQSAFGLSKARADEFKSTIADIGPELTKLGYAETEFAGVLTDTMAGLGTSASIGQEALVELAASFKVTGQQVGTLASNFRDVGISIYDVGDEMKGVVDYARSVGVSVKAVSEGVVKNLEKMNIYNFDNGVKGLAKMAATSERLGLSMDTVFNQADKIMNPEGAIEMSAALQRLGVTSSGLLDPLRAMDMAQNDPEALQKEMVNLGKEFTTFNEKTGKMEILPGAKRRLKEVAEAAGMTREEFSKMALKSADFEMKLKQIKMPSIAGDQETKELIASMAQMKDGVATVQVKDVKTGIIGEKKVEELTADDIKSLQQANEDSSKSIEEISMSQLTTQDQILNYIKSGEIAAKFGQATAPTIQKLGNVVSSSYRDVAKGFSEGVGGTKGIRSTAESIYAPAERVVKGLVNQDPESTMKALTEIGQNFVKVGENFTNKTEITLNKISTDVLGNIEKAYGKSSQVSETKNINVNVKVEANANAKDMVDSSQITQQVINAMTDPTNSTSMTNNLTGKNQPSAATGSKN